MRVLYLYAGARTKRFEEWRAGREPDTPLVGLNHLGEFGIEAHFFENWFTELFRRLSFNLTQLPALFVLRRYDAVFSGAGLVTLFIVKNVLRWKHPRWFIYNTYLSNLLKRNRHGIKAMLIRKAIASADGIICPSQAQSDYLKQAGFDPARIFFIPYGIDTDFYVKHLTDTSPANTPYIFSAGRDIGRDYATLIEAMKDQRVPLLIGALPRNFPGRDVFPSHISVKYFPPLEMPSLMHASAFVVIPTIPEEQMVGSDCSGQYVLLEAMTCGKAVIATRRTTLPDYFEDGVDGLTIPPQDPAALATAINTLLADPARARRMGEHARTKALTHFTTKRFAKDFAHILLKTKQLG